MAKDKKLTPAEWEIMDAIWETEKSPSVREIVDTAFKNGEKAYTTVQTVMNTLVKKGLLSAEKIGLVNFYTPTKSRDDMIKAETGSIISRMFHGSAPAMANFLIDSEELTLDEIAKIKKVLEEKEEQLKGK